MKNDPIVEEVRKARAKLTRQHGGVMNWMKEIMAKQTPEAARSRPGAPKRTKTATRKRTTKAA